MSQDPHPEKNHKERIVMKDLAKKAGVHVSTVSLALNNNPRIPEKTRERILKIAESMGYTPDPALKSLASYRKNSQIDGAKKSIAIVFDQNNTSIFNESEYLPLIQRTATEYLAKLGYNCNVLFKDRDFTGSASLNRLLNSRGIDGVLFAAIFYENSELEIDYNAYSIVKIHDFPTSLPVDTIMPDHIYSIGNAIRHLTSIGFKRPALAVNHLDEAHTREAISLGFQHGQVHVAPENRLEPFSFARKDRRMLQQEMEHWLLKNQPDVLLSTWNNFAEVTKETTRKGVCPCEFVSLQQTDGTNQPGYVYNDYAKITKAALDTLIQKVEHYEKGIPEDPCLTFVKSIWVPNINYVKTGVAAR